MAICGLDEVGRGALAGPIVGCAIMFNQTPPTHLNDSKKLNKKHREELMPNILDLCSLCLVTWIDVDEINQKGIGWANKEIFHRLISEIEADEFIVDGNLKLFVEDKKIQSLVDADEKIPEVMAASIVAKVSRDTLMQQRHTDFSMYGWDKNVGYGTRTHIDGIRQHGCCVQHRTLFVRNALG